MTINDDSTVMPLNRSEKTQRQGRFSRPGRTDQTNSLSRLSRQLCPRKSTYLNIERDLMQYVRQILPILDREFLDLDRTLARP